MLRRVALVRSLFLPTRCETEEPKYLINDSGEAGYGVWELD
jgi:hypothetical protein